MLEGTDIISILDLREKEVFRDASVSNVVPLLRKSEESEDQISVLELDKGTLSNVNQIPQSLIAKGTDNSIRLSKSVEDSQLIDKIENQSVRFEDIYYANWGLRTGTAEKTERYVVESSNDPRAEPMIRGRDVIDRYRLATPSEYIIYEKENLYNPMFEELFENTKIVFRKISGEGLMAVVDEEELYCFSTLIPCVNIQKVSDVDRTGIPDITPEAREYENPYYALAIVNSQLLSWYYAKNLSDNLSVVPNHIKELPIPKVEFSESRNNGDQLSDTKAAYREFTCKSGSWTPFEILNTIPDSDSSDVSQLEHDFIAFLAREQSEYHSEQLSLNLDLLDYLGAYSDGPTLADLDPNPPEGLSNSILTETTETRNSLRVGTVDIARTDDSLTVSLTARYKPENPDEHETDQWDYTETEPEPAMEFRGLDDAQAALVEAFVPVAVEEAGGFAGFRETATKTNSLVDRLEALTLPALDDVRDGVERYREARERATELDERIERTDALIDEIVYDLYGLTEEEIEIVEEAVGE